MLRRKEALPEGVVELEIAHRDGMLHVRGARDSEELRRRLARMFQLHLDLADIHEKCGRDGARWGRWQYLAYWCELWEENAMATALQQAQASGDQ